MKSGTDSPSLSRVTPELLQRLQADPDPASAASCDLAFLHLVSAGLVTAREDDLVTATLRAVLVAAVTQRGAAP